MLSKSIFMMMMVTIFGLIMPMATMASPSGDVVPAVEEFQADNVSRGEGDLIAELHKRQVPPYSGSCTFNNAGACNGRGMCEAAGRRTCCRRLNKCSNERNRCEIRAAGIIAICW
ncbi:hypothetical protein IWW34DRAFT_774378 [Fusarium oxysporum f. sp. albedinis]|nr:hypothetical protein IWW34DRAFT_774378 [Fusarium oxysporum f. sp. albedinis]KAK2470646.1 hypothetical protein H9L39_17745 [Fusarium oxysporum f. sp. albedinis]